MTDRFVAGNIDLSRLPAPEVIKNVSFEAILAARLADLVARFAAAGIDIDTTSLETEPAAILQQEDAYREALDLAAINDAARAIMLPFATGGNLENLAAFYGVKRLIVTAAVVDDAGNVVTPAVMESDDALRRRVQLAPEALPYAGMTGGGYKSLALLTAPECKDVATIKRPGGHVDVVLLGREGNGVVSNDTVTKVYAAFQDDEATQLTDIISVRSATVTNYAVNVLLRVRGGPDPATVRAAASTALATYVAGRHEIGETAYLAGLIAAAKVGGVDDVVINSPADDVVPPVDGVAYCTGITVASELLG